MESYINMSRRFFFLCTFTSTLLDVYVGSVLDHQTETCISVSLFYLGLKYKFYLNCLLRNAQLNRMIMVFIVQALNFLCNRVWEMRDKRTDGWPLMGSPLTPLLICQAYLILVKVIGPKLMQNRPPYELRGALVVYNLFQILFNGWMFHQICRMTWFNGYSLICQPMDYSNNEDALQLIRMGYIYSLSKLIDFIDTLFFILRKKENQITFYHVYHHVCMLLTVWIGFRFISGGQSAFLPTANTLVNVGVHIYYLITAMGPRFRQYLWWKKYLTAVQTLEFVFIGVHGSQMLFVECDFPSAVSWYYVVQVIVFTLLFRNLHSNAKTTDADIIKTK